MKSKAKNIFENLLIVAVLATVHILITNFLYS